MEADRFFAGSQSLESDSIYVGCKPSTEFGWKPVFAFWLEARGYVLAGSPFLLESDLEGPARGLGWKPARHGIGEPTIEPVPLSYKLCWKPGASWLEARWFLSLFDLHPNVVF